jgi:hypothetical protein
MWVLLKEGRSRGRRKNGKNSGGDRDESGREGTKGQKEERATNGLTDEELRKQRN